MESVSAWEQCVWPDIRETHHWLLRLYSQTAAPCVVLSGVSNTSLRRVTALFDALSRRLISRYLSRVCNFSYLVCQCVRIAVDVLDLRGCIGCVCVCFHRWTIC